VGPTVLENQTGRRAGGRLVAFKAHLSPPLPPLWPGGYDFACCMYFQRIGASGFVLGAIRAVPVPGGPGFWLRAAAFFDAMREVINGRIHAVLPADRGSIASALAMGKRDAIFVLVVNAFCVSNLAHVLEILGYHIAAVSGIAFSLIRTGLDLVPAPASWRAIKKWAAAAPVTGAFYLVLSGTSVSTQRALITVTIVLIGVTLDRPALTFCALAVAAFAVLLLSPQALVHPSFQIPFAAALALIATYQYGVPGGEFWRAKIDTSRDTHAAL
jgi:competence protein ComEC